MKATTRMQVLFLVVLSAGCTASDKPWEIHGRVVDELGEPLDDFDAATFWSSNGKQWERAAERNKADGKRDIGSLWREEGVIAAFPQGLAKHLPNGEFVVQVESRPRVSVFVTDRQQRRGGYVAVERTDAAEPVTIKLLPLVRVHGRIYCPDAERTPDWTMVVIHPPGDMENYLHFTQCGSVKGEFSFLLPPGKFDFQVYSSSPDARMPKPSERPHKDTPADMPPYLSGVRVDVPTGQSTLDLGTLNVELPVGVGGVKGDYSRYYGKEPPALSITDARGVAKGLKLTDLRGKWVLLDFWTLWCGPCVHESLPRLAKLYTEHPQDRDRFEILSICVTTDEKITSIEEFDRFAAPLVRDVWSGKPLPFPVLIDGEGKTGAVYGIISYPTVLLIDPDGHLVKSGDEELLADKLGGKEP